MRLGQDFEGAVTGGLSLEVPLFNLNGGARDEANAREVLRKAELEEEVESVIVEVRKHYRQVQAAAEGSHHFKSVPKKQLKRLPRQQKLQCKRVR